MNQVIDPTSLDAETMTTLAVEGQRKILADLLAKGIPLTYLDEAGRRVREYPDGRIEDLETGDTCQSL